MAASSIKITACPFPRKSSARCRLLSIGLYAGAEAADSHMLGPRRKMIAMGDDYRRARRLPTCKH